MKFTLRGASSAALVIGIMGGGAWAQEAPAPSPETVQSSPEPQAVPEAAEAADQVAPAGPAQSPDLGDHIVVTGSLVAGASEDASLPVETFNLEDLADQGSPTASEFLKSLTISSEASGEADSQVLGAAAGLSTVNLRGLGAGRTMVLLNGRRFSSSDTADVNTLPMMAIGRIEVLKDGASVTYGAGAVGGVINYITRKDFEGFEVNVEKKLFDGSKGEDNLELLWGAAGDSSNLLIGASYGKRHELAQSKRDWSLQPFDQLPAIWTLVSTNPSQYRLDANRGTLIRDYTPDSCRAIGGEITGVLNPSHFAPNDCAVYLPSYFNLIDEEEYLRGYLEYNFDFNDTTEFHFELAYAKTTNPNIQTGASLPSGNKRAQYSGGLFGIPYDQTTYTAAGVATSDVYLNPYAVEFFNRAAANGLYTGAPGDLDTSASYDWRPLMFGGHPLYPGNHRQEFQQRERWGGSMSVKGDFTREGLIGRFLPEGTTFEYAATYNQYVNESRRPDFIVSRLQDALNGYGGPGCAAIDRVATDYSSTAAYDRTVGIQSDTAPGTNGCEYFNPFASSFSTSFVNGAANPAYGGAAFENSVGLLDWLTHDRGFETTNQALTIDAVYSGEIPSFELPGGAISWAAGTQWRQTETRGLPIGEEEDIMIAASECTWGNPGLSPTAPGQSDCEAQLGPFFGSGLGRQFAYKTDRQVISYFGELQFPVLDNLNVQLAGRREEFGDITGDIWKIAAKYDVLPTLAFRGSYSTNFQAPPEDLGVLGVETGGVYVGSLFRTVPTLTTTVPGITPEDDRSINLGVIWAPEVLGGDFRVSLDFWEIVIDGEIASTNTSQVFQNVFGTTAPSVGTFANCSASFINLIQFTSPCNDTVGSPTRTTANNIANVDRYQLNTGGYITNGLDFAMDYTRDLGPGELYARASATQVLVYKVKGFEIPGVSDANGNPLVYQQSFDGLGSANLARGGTIMPEWRANASLGYSLDEHRFNVRANFISGFQDDVAPTRVGTNLDGTPKYPTYGMTPSDYLDFDFSYIYEAPWMQDLQLRLSVLNFTDEDPMPAQHTNAGGAADTRTGYYPGYGNPRGRQFEIGVTKKF